MATHRTPRAWRVALVLSVALALAALAGPVVYVSLAAPPNATLPTNVYDWPQFNGDAQHSGNNTLETAISPANVADLRRIFLVPLPGLADGAPAEISGASTAGGVRDLLFLTTRGGTLLALDAHTGSIVWFAAHGAGSCQINGSGGPCYTTSSPAIDPNRQYVYTYGLDGYVHKHRIWDGTEATGGGWPEQATLKPFDEKGSSALSIATTGGAGYLYVANGGYPGDRGDYQGHVTVINLADGSQRVFNANCSDQAVHFAEAPGTPDCPAVQSAVWARPGVVYSAATGRLYLATGNGAFSPAAHNWGDSVLALRPDGTGGVGGPLDSYTPANFQQLENTDEDLGSTEPAILPALPVGSAIRHLAVQGGKDGLLRLLNLDNLGGGGAGLTGGEVGPGVPVPQGGAVLTQPAVWTDPVDSSAWVFVANGAGISGLRLSSPAGSLPALQPVWQQSGGGTSPIVANGVLYYAGSNRVRALDPRTGRQLWQDTSIGGIHWESPIVAGGVLYVADETGNLTAFAPMVLPRRVYLPVILKR